MKVIVKGIVQGVGFRPFVYKIATDNNLSGFVFNDSKGVTIEVEGEESNLESFIDTLKSEPPPLSYIEDVHVSVLSPAGHRGFAIRGSESKETDKFVLMSPDISICNSCYKELTSSSDRRYRYPFINCTHCGPRFTIIQDVPYDRDKTTMQDFQMCPDCRGEYEDPLNRRFHAQPNACHVCGPQVYLLHKDGGKLFRDEAINQAVQHLKNGRIVAVKGIGGYHLACNAEDDNAVQNLRKKKYREDKPFALMAARVEDVQRFCEVNNEEERLLLSHERPIVLLLKKKGISISESVAPNQRYLGFMLPYTPLHHLLLKDSCLVLVMTSGNLSDEPIAYQDSDAFSRLWAIADYFLSHNRRIYLRCDDSVVRVWRGRDMVLRRSRGYVPQPIKVPFKFRKVILACGGHLKNTFCLTRETFAFLSHHIGDLENIETLTSFEKGIEHFKKLFYIEPEVIAHDIHPEYLATKYAKDMANYPEDIVRIPVQHHHAHIASCMADNGIESKAIGVAFDGIGYGEDGNLWGGEFLVADFKGYERHAHFAYLPLPGGEAAIREPWRMAAAYLYNVYGRGMSELDIGFVRNLDMNKWDILEKMMKVKINSPLTSGVGRLFDAVSSLIGLRNGANYEGQAAVELEMVADNSCMDRYNFSIVNRGEIIIIEYDEVIRGIVSDIKRGLGIPIISAKFHNGIASVVREVCEIIRDKTQLKKVALSGGVFQNIFLLERTFQLLTERGFTVYTHSRVPTNDGGLCLGQAVIANARLGEAMQN